MDQTNCRTLRVLSTLAHAKRYWPLPGLMLSWIGLAYAQPPQQPYPPSQQPPQAQPPSPPAQAPQQRPEDPPAQPPQQPHPPQAQPPQQPLPPQAQPPQAQPPPPPVQPSQQPYPPQAQPPQQPYPPQAQPPQQPYPPQAQPPQQPYPQAQPYPQQPYPGSAQPQPYPQQQGQAVGVPPGQTAQEQGAGLQPPPIELSAPDEAAPPLVGERVTHERWYDAIEVGAFADTYFSLNYGLPRPQAERNRFRAFDTTNGFALAWAGLDVGIGNDVASGTLSLRFGPSAQRLAGDDSDWGLDVLKQAYATWRPGGEGALVSFDLGRFDTIYGAEVAESQLNFNYTRGLLYWLAQPQYHTGLRANLDFSDSFWLTAMVTNGWNNAIDNNIMKSFGVQASFATPPTGANEPSLFDAHLGFLFGPEQRDYGVVDYCAAPETFDPLERDCNTRLPNSSRAILRDAGSANQAEAFRYLIDLVIGLNPSQRLSFLFNADLGIDNARRGSPDTDASQLAGFESELWWGVSAAGRFAFSEQAAVALRGEVYGDPEGRAARDDDPHIVDVRDLVLGSATLTLEYVPVPFLILRLDNRLDIGNVPVFPRRLRSYEKVVATTTLGVVVTTN